MFLLQILSILFVVEHDAPPRHDLYPRMIAVPVLHYRITRLYYFF